MSVLSLVFGIADGTAFCWPCPFSGCSCDNGCFFCSHREGLILGISLAQAYLKNGKIDNLMEYFRAKEDPRLAQGKPILLENYTMRAESEHLQAEKNRKGVVGSDETPAKKKGNANRIRVTP